MNNNEGSRISCCAFNNDATTVSAKIKLNQILLIENATVVQTSSYNEGNAAFELQMKHFTELTDLGCFDIKQTYGNIDQINIDQVSQKIGYIKTEGYVRDKFVIVIKLKSSEYFGTITDGTFKLEVVISNVSKEIEVNRGQKIQILRNDQEHENEDIYVIIQNPDHLKIIEGPSMPLADLISGGRIIWRNEEE